MHALEEFDRQDFTTDYLGDGVRYRLPRRQFQRAQHIGWLVSGCGLITTLFMLAWMSGPIIGGIGDLRQGGTIGWFSIFFGCLGLFGLVPGLGMLLGGIDLLRHRTYCEIEVRAGRLTVKECLTLFRLRRQRATQDIHRLRIVAATEDRGGRQEYDTRAWLGDFDSALVAETADDGKFLIAAAYPRPLLERLADELAPRLEAELNNRTIMIEREPSHVAAGQPHSRKIEIVEALQDQQAIAPAPVQPAGSSATIERRPDGITITVPPAGLWKGSKGLVLFAILWNALISIFLVVASLAAAGIVPMEGDGPPWMMLLIMIPFVAVGVALVVASVNMGRRHATIATADDLMMLVRHSIFGKATNEWSASQLESIRCGNSGMEVNGEPVQELQIIPIAGNKVGCLSQLDHDDLTWIAAELNETLMRGRLAGGDRLLTAAVARDASGLPVPNAGSRVVIEQSTNGLRLAVPPAGLLKYAGPLVLGVIFLAIGIGAACGIGWEGLHRWQGGIDFAKLIFASFFLFGFGGVGSAATVAALVAGRRRFHLTSGSGELTLSRHGPFGHKQFRWGRDELGSIEVVDSGTQVNGRTLYQVFIRSPKGPSVGIMTGHDRRDLQLVATALHESLGLSHPDLAPA